MRVLIADDEPLCRRGIRVGLRSAPDVEVIGECSTGTSALQTIIRKRPDLVFLDIQMPEMNGCDVLARLPEQICPLVIFLTAHEEYALVAFRFQAVDYLLKPFDDDRFAEALDRARRRLQDQSARSLVKQFHAILAPRSPAHQEREYRQQFKVKNGNRRTLVPVQDISWIEASGDYVGLHAYGKTFLIRETLDTVERELDPMAFARVHRSAIVATAGIKEYRSLTSGDLLITLRDGVVLRGSRRYRSNLNRQSNLPVAV